MKQCATCSKPSVYHVTILKNGDVHELHFCENHFHEYMKEPEETKTAEEAFIESLMPDSELEEELSELDQISCPNCGITYKEFRESGRFGCPHDYTTFVERLIPLLENIHNATEHTGKVPAKAPISSKQHLELMQLQHDLNEAIQAEDYERAAELRDEIALLEKNSPQSDS